MQKDQLPDKYKSHIKSGFAMGASYHINCQNAMLECLVWPSQWNTKICKLNCYLYPVCQLIYIINMQNQTYYREILASALKDNMNIMGATTCPVAINDPW